MIDLLLGIVSGCLLLAGAAFCLIGALGLVRLPDFFSRLHAAGLVDTLGLGLLFLGLIIQAGFSFSAAKLLLILAFVFFTAPTASHALARAAEIDGERPKGEPTSPT